MPSSTFSAVRMPGSESPSSTSVMATAGRMPTTTVSASSTREIEAMVARVRPTNESTMSSALMSMITPWQPVDTIRSARSSCNCRATWSSMSVWIDTSNMSPILRTGTRSTSVLLARDAPPGLHTGQPQHVTQRVGERGLGGDVAELDAEGDDCLRDLRPDARDDAVGAHQPGGHDGLQDVLGDLG